MKILYTGANGQLGHELHRAAQRRKLSVVGMTRTDLDITQPNAISAAIATHQPTVIINCAAYTAVDKAEAESDLAFAVNRDGPAHLAEICRTHHIALIHISTDYVFDGTKQAAYLESDPICPINLYGQSKAAGEILIAQNLTRHIIIRTAWLYGEHGYNFVKTMLRLGCERDEIGVVDDQFGSPTYAADLAETALTVAAAVQEETFCQWGIYHFANQGMISWYQFAKAIFEYAAPYLDLKLNRLNALTTDQYPTIAVRPEYSVLSSAKISRQFGVDPPFYRDSLEKMLARVLSY